MIAYRYLLNNYFLLINVSGANESNNGLPNLISSQKNNIANCHTPSKRSENTFTINFVLPVAFQSYWIWHDWLQLLEIKPKLLFIFCELFVVWFQNDQ